MRLGWFHQKKNWKNKEAQFLIKQILMDEVEKKTMKTIVIKRIRTKFNIKTKWN